MDRLFALWMQSVSREMYKECGMGPMDLPDWGYRDAFDSGYTAVEAALEAIEAAHDY